MSEKKEIVFFTGGGTGGHIYPAVAVADELKKLSPSIDIHFVCANRPLDQKIFERIDYKKHVITILPVNTSNYVKKFLGYLVLPLAFIEALFLLILHKPKMVVGFGGYASFPALYAAYVLNIPVSIWEANAKPGMVTRLMADKAKHIFVNFKASDQSYKNKELEDIGVPTRFEYMPKQKQNRFRIFIFGGSGGARSINEKVYQLLEKVNKEKEHPLRELEFIHQIGSLDYEKFKSLYSDFDIHLEVKEYIHNMPEELAKADLLICRAGASTIAELSLSKKAAILIPLPWAADNHQFENAKALAQSQAAVLLEQKDLDIEHLESLILGFVQNPDLLTLMESNVEHFARPKAALDMAKKILLGL